MGMTVGRLMTELSEDELTEWLAYDKLDPIGAYRSDMQTALIALMQSGNSDAKLSDFVLFDPDPITEEERERRQIADEQAQRRANAEAMKAFFAHLKNKNG